MYNKIKIGINQPDRTKNIHTWNVINISFYN